MDEKRRAWWDGFATAAVMAVGMVIGAWLSFEWWIVPELRRAIHAAVTEAEARGKLSR